jgi:hypothetical protein
MIKSKRNNMSKAKDMGVISQKGEKNDFFFENNTK